jgi:hypothetical protein
MDGRWQGACIGHLARRAFPRTRGLRRFGVLLKELGIKRSLRNHENRELPFRLRTPFAI